MEKLSATSQYLHIARDLAARISKGEFPEGGKLFGRSMLASEYRVSPETIRRALRLLADMKVVEIKAQSGAKVLSTDNAKRYIANFEESASPQSLRRQFSDIPVCEAPTAAITARRPARPSKTAADKYCQYPKARTDTGSD